MALLEQFGQVIIKLPPAGNKMLGPRISVLLSLAASSPFSQATTKSSSSPLNNNNKTVAAFVVSATGAVRDFASTTTIHNVSMSSSSPTIIDSEYPGTAVERMNNARQRVKDLARGDDLNGNWQNVRRRLLWAGGLKDLPEAIPGQGYTGHSFNDYNHVDLTCMAENVTDNENDGSVVVREIAIGNKLGPGVRIASLPELGPGGSWTTCAAGCNTEPPRDVAHAQFRSRIAFKLVWIPDDNFDSFVLVDDDGAELARGRPTSTGGRLPALRDRQLNYRIVQGSKYAKAADAIAGARKKKSKS